MIWEHPESDIRLLYTCALDAQEVGNGGMALKSMTYILRQAEGSSIVAPKMPVILRSMIRLTMKEIEGTRDARSLVESICGLYESGTHGRSACWMELETNVSLQR